MNDFQKYHQNIIESQIQYTPLEVKSYWDVPPVGKYKVTFNNPDDPGKENGSIRYYVNGEVHRDDGPAIVKQKNNIILKFQWYINGHRHREGKPAVEVYNDNGELSWTTWWQNGLRHRLDGPAIERLKDITYQNTLNLLGSKINVLFFDATTIYFESFTEDNLKKCGYSKDKKFGQPQVLLALLVTDEGLPVDYAVFEGNKYEGHTLIPVLSQIKKKYNIGKAVFVADSAMMADYNTKFLDTSGFSYIVGARLKGMPKDIRNKILNGSNYIAVEDGASVASFKYGDKRLIVSYSARRAAKDARDRDAAVSSIQKRLSKTANPKEYLSSYGYKKYIKLSKAAQLSLDEDRIAADCAWDGLLGVITNDKDASPNEVLGHYHNLYQVEDAFRVTKHDLAVRPVFHWKPRRISAHISICFCAYSLIKYLEYRVRLQYVKLSPEKIRQTLIRVQTSVLFDTKRKIRYGLPSKMSLDARKIYDIFKIKKNLTPYIIKKL